MRHDLLRKYLTNPREFDGWIKSNVLVGSIVAFRHPDDGVGFPLFRGWIKPDRTFECRSRVERFELTKLNPRGSLFPVRVAVW